jgi:arylsulfatase A-like enzyme
MPGSARAVVALLGAILSLTAPSPFGSLRVTLSEVEGPGATVDAQTRPRPSLLVIIVVDQMRFDYLDRLNAFWKRGIRRLLDEGAVFEQAFYPYLNTVTCVGHATIASGTFPATHGVILNEWLQRAEGRRASCTEDSRVKPVSYGTTTERTGHSAHRLRVPTLGDRLRDRSAQSRVVTLSTKPRSAVMLAGHGGAATWFSDANTWATSTAFTPSPLPEVAAYADANPVESARKIIWRRLYESPLYAGNDDAIGERPRAGWTRTFPHPLSGAPGTPESAFYDLWTRSPYSDAYLGEMAAALVQGFSLGQRDVVDLLGVSFSGLDYVGHDFGPDSHEVQDTLIRLDSVLGDLFDVLDKTVGREHYVVALSADHGVAPIPEQRQHEGKDAGRLLPHDVRAVADTALAALGPGPHIAYVEYMDVYLTEATRARLALMPELRSSVINVLSAMPGVARVMPGPGLEQKRTSTDPIERAAALSYVPGESGDLIMVPKPYWIATDSSATAHGTYHPYDQHVPVIVMGRSFVRSGRYKEPASPADIAPTLATLVDLPMPGIDGRVLAAALSRSSQ